MKIFRGLILATFAALTACGPKHHSAESPPAAAAPGAEAVLSRTEAFDDKMVAAAASTFAREGQTLSTALAEQCWTREGRRPRVKEACFLAWSGGEENSSLFAGLCHSLPGDPALHARALAVGCLRKRFTLASYSFADLQLLLDLVKEDPPWLRARAVSDWISSHSLKGTEEVEVVWNAVRPDEALAAPASVRDAYFIALRIDAGKAKQMLEDYCPPAVEGMARSRCWRFLSSLADPAGDRAHEETIRPLVPARGDAGWSLFERSFPERAALLRRFF